MYTLEASSSQKYGPPGTYIYKVVPLKDGILSISSDNVLRLINPEALGDQPLVSISPPQSDITSLVILDHDNLIICVGDRQGHLSVFDLKQGAKVATFQTDQNAAVFSVATNGDRYTVAAGTELTNAQAEVAIWDVRNLGVARQRYVESHNDDITELRYHPENASILLSGSTDGLVNVYDTTITEEEDALYQTINHGSSIHKAGFLTSRDIYALSHDEKFSVHSMTQNPDNDAEEAHAVEFGDLRETFGCEYVGDVVARPGGTAVIGLGSHSARTFDLIHLENQGGWKITPDSRVRLSEAHGEEVVRTYCFLDDKRMIVSGGEDGEIKTWRS